ncbi:uncharacterized protein LOC111518427 isoform X2 [Drosophila willistoni]|nr:uncharacterized protein LOC111518427 isoform X2 [Drosophila willistoni]XP_046865578.1 uncharacterized protein LOC111518427 isoform X2 [Drosophila willistoni]
MAHNGSHFNRSTAEKVAKQAKSKIFPAGFTVKAEANPSRGVTASKDAIREATTDQKQTKTSDLKRHGRRIRKHPTKGTEWSVSVPIYSRDRYGQWIDNPWAVTFGDVFLDTHFAPRARHTLGRVLINSNPVKNYYPFSGNASTVCINQSTVYGDIKVEKWLETHIFTTKLQRRPFYMELRKDIFKDANSEECHKPEYSDWREYQECALRRNQRMEMNIPNYPLHQIIKDKRIN